MSIIVTQTFAMSIIKNQNIETQNDHIIKFFLHARAWTTSLFSRKSSKCDVPKINVSTVRKKICSTDVCGLLNYYVCQLCKGTSERCEKRQCFTGFWRKCHQWFRNINWKTRIEQYRRLQNIMLHTCATSTPAKYIPMVRSILTIQMTKDSGPTLPLNTMYGLKFGPNLHLYMVYGNRKSAGDKKFGDSS